MYMNLPGGSDGKESACNAGDMGLIPGSARKWQPIPVFLPGKSHGLEKPGGLQSRGSQRIRHDLATKQEPMMGNVKMQK